MIGSLRGTLTERIGTEVLVEVGGIGYRVTVTPACAGSLGELGDEVFVNIHHHMREDDQQLFGFETADERRVFEVLLSTHGVGPSLALAILSVHDPAGLHRVMADDDIAALCLVPGVGKKTAARLFVELKSKLDVADSPLATAVNTAGSTGNGSENSTRGDVREALLGLGYGDQEIHGALRQIAEDGDASDQLKEALRLLAVAT